MKLVFKMFLNDETAKSLYLEAQRTGCELKKKQLDKLFNNYFFDICLTSYIKQTVLLTSKNLYKKKCILNDHELYILNSPIKQADTEYLDLIEDKRMDVFEKCSLEKLNELCEDYDISKTLCKLTERQRLIIYLHFVEDMSIKSISRYIGITEKAASKSKVAAINNLRKCKGETYLYGRVS